MLGPWIEKHIDLKDSVAWLRKGSEEKLQGKKAWGTFPRTQRNENSGIVVGSIGPYV